jgi:hypothetical protein
VTTPEGKIKALCKALFRRVGAYRVMIVTYGYGESGHPDFLVGLHGVLIGVETKATRTEHPSKLQLLRLQQIRDAGAMAFVVNADNFQAFETLIIFVNTNVSSAIQRIADERGIARSALKPWIDYNPLVLSAAAWQAAHRYLKPCYGYNHATCHT